MTANHPLDRPVWNTLTGRQTAFAIGDGQARRFDPRYGPLTGVADHSPASLADLARLPAGPDGLWLLEADPVPPPRGMAVTNAAECVQMVAAAMTRGPDIAFTALTDDDAAEMLALATLTRPGPFAEHTNRLGDFIGVRQDGVLVAMAGERMRPEGFTEISGVCTLAEHRGRGLAAGLTRMVMRRILERDETPFLHSYASNAGAIGLYETLGFRVRREMHLTVLANLDDVQL